LCDGPLTRHRSVVTSPLTSTFVNTLLILRSVESDPRDDPTTNKKQPSASSWHSGNIPRHADSMLDGRWKISSRSSYGISCCSYDEWKLMWMKLLEFLLTNWVVICLQADLVLQQNRNTHGPRGQISLHRLACLEGKQYFSSIIVNSIMIYKKENK
jgi:hypothetical protein